MKLKDYKAVTVNCGTHKRYEVSQLFLDGEVKFWSYYLN